MNEVNGKQIICNGSINKSLNLEELLQFDIADKKTAIHYLQTEGEYAHSFEEIDRDVFQKLPELYGYTERDKFTDEQTNEALTIVYNRLREHEKQMQGKTVALHRTLGKLIYEAMQTLKFSGELELTIGQLLGFIAKVGDCNDFRVSNVERAINKLHNLAPRIEYGPNNPNTGRLWHNWSIKSDYIFMNFGLCREEAVQKLDNWFKTVQDVKALSKADSFRLSIQDVGDKYYYVQIVMWWD